VRTSTCGGRRAREFDRLVDRRLDAQRLARDFRLAAEGHDLLRQAAPAFRSAGDLGEKLPDHRVLTCFAADFGKADDGAEDVIEVVGDAAGERADGFELLRLAQLAFEFLALGGLPLALGDVFAQRAIRHLEVEHLLLQLRDEPRVVFLQVDGLVLRFLDCGAVLRPAGFRERLLQRLHELIGLHRLDEEALRAKAQRKGGVARIGVGSRVKDEGDAGEARVALQLAAELKAIHARHEDIRDHEIILAGVGEAQGLHAVAGRIHFVAVPAQQGLEHVEVLGLVIDAQDFHGRGGLGIPPFSV
jgi:hypothetical protein